MRSFAIIAVLAVAACNSSSPPAPPPADNVAVDEPDANVIGYDRCGEPVHEGQRPRDANTPCR